ncbi:MAG: DISARM system helicase DrmA [Planctomycetes bacterium]|nr:DISARM system helicase DrmA [Planctomycetota bacterium]
MTRPPAPTGSVEVRSRLVDALRLDLVGPDARIDADELINEVLPEAPSNWYLTGFLAPAAMPMEERGDDGGDEANDEGGDEGGADDGAAPERPIAQRAFFPASMGLSVLLAPGCRTLHCVVSWGDYAPEAKEGGPRQWLRTRRREEVDVGLSGGQKPLRVPVPDSKGLWVVVVERPASSGPQNAALPAGARSAAVFVVNERTPSPDQPRDVAFAFQVELVVTSERPFIARPDARGVATDDWDERVADVHYLDVHEYAVGHNVSAAAVLTDHECREVRTTWLPATEVERVDVAKLDGVVLSMEEIAKTADVTELRASIGPIVGAYGAWIEDQATRCPSSGPRAETSKALLDNARRARARMADGLDALEDAKAFEAFCIANRTVARAIRQRLSQSAPFRNPDEQDPPAWRPFQLAFLLLNLRGMVDPRHDDRETVDLLFFPTGGGKTEAYLGLAAFAIALRRLRDPSIQSSGVTVLMRYTLRLLTLDQLGRAATLICALELERKRAEDRLGSWPIEIGLWVGKSATANAMGHVGDGRRDTARAIVTSYKAEPKGKPSPIPLENCPWCGEQFRPDSFQLMPNATHPEELGIGCVRRECEFWGRRQMLPLQAIDEPIYRRLPAFLIATVDKFASLPWVGPSGALLGLVERYDAKGFYGSAEPGHGKPLGGPLPPPDLVIQDELHLISGPLGTMVGLYETVIDALCGRPVGLDGVRPKVIASTATVRRAQRQIQALFARPHVEVFPPPGPDRKTTFFSVTRPPGDGSARLYVGVAAQGRNLKVVLMRTYLVLLAAGKKSWADCGYGKNPRNPADPYMTLVGYFNSLRELGGSRRIVEDEVKARLTDYGDRRRRVGDTAPLFANRTGFKDVRELTSREATNKVADTKRCLTLGWDEDEHVDVALATNMISVGLDITRLGLMVVTGQPKSAAEYIQATSRVGRDAEKAGLVVTLLNVNRARDRSHYERFANWHASFYRAVEATSVTPFSPRAVDRGLAAIVVALARHGHPGLTAPRGAERIGAERGNVAFVEDTLVRRGQEHAPLSQSDADELRTTLTSRSRDLLDSWVTIAKELGQLQYGREDQPKALLRDPLDPAMDELSERQRKFKANRSLRDVEPSVNLRIIEGAGGGAA